METIDRAYLEAQTFGDRALARELLGLFADQCRRIGPALGDASVSLQDRADLAHTLKGSAASVGARQVWALCAEAEATLREGDECRPALAALGPAIEAVLAVIVTEA